jgi:hypothetical protein
VLYGAQVGHRQPRAKIRELGGDDAAQQDDYLGDATTMNEFDGRADGRRSIRGDVPAFIAMP